MKLEEWRWRSSVGCGAKADVLRTAVADSSVDNRLTQSKDSSHLFMMMILFLFFVIGLVVGVMLVCGICSRLRFMRRLETHDAKASWFVTPSMKFDFVLFRSMLGLEELVE